MKNSWKIDYENSPNFGLEIFLVHERQLPIIPDGTKLICIDGTEVVKGIDWIDDDTRGGYLAYGTLKPLPDLI